LAVLLLAANCQLLTADWKLYQSYSSAYNASSRGTIVLQS
jgi:hypothetical protein